MAAGALGGGASGSRRHPVPGTLCFIAGFSLVFVILGVLLSGTLLLLGGAGRIIKTAAGLIIIILGLNSWVEFLPFLNYEKRFHPAQRRGLGGAFLTGAAFGAGWTPCVGPILGSVFLMAGQSGKIGAAALCLAAYSAGLGLPFLGASLALEPFLRRAARLRPYRSLIQRLSGLFLIGLGLLMLLDRFQGLNTYFIQGEYGFIRWARGGSPWVRIVPAFLFFIPALLLTLSRLRRGKPLFAPLPVILLCLLCALGTLQIAGLLDCAGLLARWFVFRQNI
jgi:cytochrome c-type biogenesis protein